MRSLQPCCLRGFVIVGSGNCHCGDWDAGSGMGSLQSCCLTGFVIVWSGVQAAEWAVKAGVASGGGAALPGLMMNLNKSYKDQTDGQERDVTGGRLECSMQVGFHLTAASLYMRNILVTKLVLLLRHADIWARLYL